MSKRGSRRQAKARGRAAHPKTLRERAHTTLGRTDREWLAATREVLANSRVLDASEAFAYFWDDTPSEEVFRFEDIPPVSLPGALLDPTGPPAVFVEAAAPASGLAWGRLLNPDNFGVGTGAGTGVGNVGANLQDSLTSGAVGKITAAAAAREVPLAITVPRRPGTPGLLAADPGLVRRAGAHVFVEEGPLSGESANFYRRLFGPEWSRTNRCAAVLHVLPFFELVEEAEGTGTLRDAALQLPQCVHYLPVDETGRVKTIGGEQGLPMVLPGDNFEQPEPSTTDALSRAHRPLKLAAVFALACARVAARTSSETSVSETSLEPRGEDAFGPVLNLRIAGLTRLLDDRGKARKLGLSHALTVCRDQFEPPED